MNKNHSSTVATFRDEDGRLDYIEAPPFDFDVGDSFELGGEVLRLWISGKLVDEEVWYFKVHGRERELDVEAKEWYVNYRVFFYDGGNNVVSRETLDTDELRETVEMAEPNQ